MREFFTFFALQFVQYLNLTIDYRAIAHRQYAVAIATNVLAPILAWTMVRHVGRAKNEYAGMAAVALGGALSAALGIWLTAAWD